jgi:hypothetical protein
MVNLATYNKASCLEGIREFGGIAQHIHFRGIDEHVSGKTEVNKVLGYIAGVCAEFRTQRATHLACL